MDEDFEALVTDDPALALESDVPCLFVCAGELGLDRLEALSAAEKKIMPGHELRFLPGIAPIHQGLAAGKLGVPGLLRLHLWLSDAIPAGQLAFDYFDIANRLFGTKAEIGYSHHSDEYLQVHLGFPNGGMALIDIATARPTPGRYFSMHLIGSDGATYADDHRNAHPHFTNTGTQALIPPPNTIMATPSTTTPKPSCP